MLRTITFVTLALAGLSASPSYADIVQPCPRYAAPGNFYNPPRWGSDVGPVVDGFVDMKNAVHGVDVYHSNNVDYRRIAACGGQFAVAKLSDPQKDRYAYHQSHFTAAKIPTFPYFFFYMPSGYTSHPELYSAQLVDKQYATLEQWGRSQADLFIAEYQTVVSPASTFTALGWRTPLVAVDVETTITDQALKQLRAAYNGPASERENFVNRTKFHYGSLYAAAVAAWIKRVHARFPNLTVIFYFFPSILPEYIQGARKDDFLTIHGLPMWLASPRPDGGEPDWHKSSLAARICWSNDLGNRCVIHQYTDRGIFGQAPVHVPKGQNPPHMDLDRMFPVKSGSDSSGVQYVRKDDLR